MNILRVAIASPETYKKRTLAIAKGKCVPKKDEPKAWLKSLGTLSQVLSGQNRDLLKLILQTHPQSLSELAEKSSAVFVKDSMLLSPMERYGLIHFEQDPNRQLVPRFDYAGVEQEMSFRG